MLAQLRASGLSLAEIADHSGVSKRTLEDIQYGRSTGARIVSQLRPLYDGLQRRREERRILDQVRDQARMQVTQAQAPQLMETARAVAEMEIAAWQREQNERLYRAALRYLGPAYAAMGAWLGSDPGHRQFVIQAANEQREREQRMLEARASMGNPFARLFNRQSAPRIEAPAPRSGQPRQIAPPASYVPYTPPASPLPRRALGDGMTIPDDDELPRWLR